MKQHFLKLTLRLGVAALLWPPAHAWSGAAAAGRQAEQVELPRRISRQPPSPPVPPELPAEANELPPVSFEWVVAWEGPDGARGRVMQRVVRTAERILMVTERGANEWLFERNPVNARRVSGYLVDHENHRVLLHYDSDLRSRLRLRGWSDVLSLGFAPGALKDLRATGETQTVAGVAFERYVAPQPTEPGVVEVWWSESLLVPLLLTVRDGDVLRTSTLEAPDTRVQTAQLADPRERFPRYAVLDASDVHDRAR